MPLRPSIGYIGENWIRAEEHARALLANAEQKGAAKWACRQLRGECWAKSPLVNGDAVM